MIYRRSVHSYANNASKLLQSMSRLVQYHIDFGLAVQDRNLNSQLGVLMQDLSFFMLVGSQAKSIKPSLDNKTRLENK